MKLCFIFSHGFGFDYNFWNNLAPYFNQYKCIYLDHGYFGEEKKFLYLDKNLVFIGIGHSLGFKKLLSLPILYTKLIGLQGFVNFLGFNYSLYHKRNNELIRLKESLKLSPIITLKNFYQRCGLENYSLKLNQMNLNRLNKDLESIIDIPPSIQVPTLIVGTKDDKIVTKKLIYDNFSNQSYIKIIILDQGKHSLGYVQAEQIYQLIINFIDNS